MKPVFKHGLSLVTVMILAACSSAESRRQASDDFNYLKTPKLSTWTSLPDQHTEFSKNYNIPQGEFNGALGEGVDIRPPKQLLALIPGLRFQRDKENVYVWMPSTELAQGFADNLNKTVTQGDLPTKSKSDYVIETDWINWNNDENADIGKGRVSISPQKTAANYGFLVELVEWQTGKEGMVFVESEMKKDFVTQITNRLLLSYDNHVRDEARLRALNETQKIAVSLGKDRSGLSVIIAREPFDAVWTRLPSVLDTLGFSIEDRNSSQGVFNVEYKAPNKAFWSELGMEPLALSEKKFDVQLGDLRNRTSINFITSKGKPVSDGELTQLNEAIKRVFDKE